MRRVVRAVLLLLTTVAVLQSIPAELRYFRAAWPVLRLWPDGDAQQRATLGNDLYDTLEAAQQHLPQSAPVLLVTPGIDPRHTEYTAFHRALYELAPRPVWWMNPAPSDGTWEARWWISAPIDAAAVRRIALDQRVDSILFLNAPVPDGLGNPRRLSNGAQLVTVKDSSELESNRAIRSSSGVRVTLGVTTGLLVVMVLGLLLVGGASSFGFDAGRLEALALAWPLGGGAVTMAMLWLNAAGVRLSHQVTVIAIVVVCTALAAIARHQWRAQARALATPASRRRLRPTVATIAVMGAIAAVTAIAAVQAACQPLNLWDSWVTWGMKARIIYLENAISPTILADVSRTVTLPDYPLLMPLLEAWTFRWAASIDDRLAGLQAIAFFLSMPVIGYALMLRLDATPRWALAIAGMLATMPALAGLAGSVLADQPLAVYALIACGYCMVWLKGGTPGTLAIGAFAGGLMAWTKREGLILLAALTLATLAVGRFDRRALRGAAALAVGGVVVAGPWLATVWLLEVPHSAFVPMSVSTFAAGLDRLPFALWRMAISLCKPGWSYIWPLAAVLGVLSMRDRRRPEDVLLVTAACYLAAMAGSYIFSNYTPYQRHAVASVDRLIAHVAPLGLLWLGHYVTASDVSGRSPAPS